MPRHSYWQLEPVSWCRSSKVHSARGCREEIREEHATTTTLGPCTGIHLEFRTTQPQ